MPTAGASGKVLAIHLPVLLRGDPGPELAAIGRHLTASGRLYVGWQSLGRSEAEDTATRLSKVLGEHGFAIRFVRGESLGSGTVFRLVAEPHR